MSTSLRIYFAGSIRGGRDDQALYDALISLLREYGEVLTEHVANPALTTTGENDLPDAEIFARDLAWLRSADVLVAEVTTPSLGVGYEVAWAEQLQKQALCLYRELPGRRLSAMLAGNPRLVVRRYSTPGDVKEHLDEFLSAKRDLT
ncbi:MAG: nucleoside 2-deoxyribosyltransferase [bacterium]